MRLHQSSLRGILGFCQGRLVLFGGGGLLAGVSAVFLVGILGAMLLPSVPERAQAVEGDGGATTYAAVPTDGTTPVQTKDTSSTNAANDTYTLALGAKVDTTIPSGTYTGALTVAAVAEPGDIVINYDANGGYFNNESEQTSNEVLYSVEKLETQSINEPSLSANYDKTITIPGATSLVVSFSCNVIAIGGSTIYLYDGSGKAVASCTYGPTTGPDQSNPNTTSGTYIILGDTFSVVANYGRLAASLQATAVGYSITTTAGTE